MKKYLAILLSLCLLLGLCACANTADTAETPSDSASDTPADSGSAAGDGDVLIGIEMKTLDGAYFVALQTFLEDLCAENGWKTVALNADSDTVKEKENMESLISQGVSLIFMDPYDTEGCVSAINSAADANIPVICVDNSCGDSARNVTTVYSDSYGCGYQVGQWVAENCFEADEHIESVLIAGQKGVYVGELRRTGIMAGIIAARTGCTEEEAQTAAQELNDAVINSGSGTNEDADFTIAGIGWGDWTSNGGLDAAEDLIVANPEMNLLFGENDAMVMGAQTALTNAEMTDQVVCCAAADGQKEAYKLILDGTNYVATGENNPQKVAELAMEIAEDLLSGGDPEAYEQYTMTEAACINPDNVEEYYNPDSLF